ncbi:hypothetical protein V6N13_099483 [Hibiscus sabdariffa]
MARLLGVQRRLGQHHSTKLAKLEIKLQRELESLLDHEELLWKQKAHSDWIQFGDRNTKFFHSKALGRRRRSQIHMLQLSDGEWCLDHEILRNHVVLYFSELFKSGDRPSDLYHIRGFFPPIPLAIRDNLDCTPSPRGNS